MLYYESGVLKRALTRGTGRVGEVVTKNALQVKGIAPHLNTTDDLIVRGEVYMTYSDFEDFNREHGGQYANPRNLAAGSLKYKDCREVAKRPLRFTAFDVYYPKKKYSSDKKKLRELQKLDVPTIELKEVFFNLEEKEQKRAATEEQELFSASLPLSIENSTTRKKIEKLILSFTEKRRKIDIPVDGLVIKIDELRIREKLGASSLAPHWAIAYKFQAEQSSTTVEKIELSLSRNGDLCPRALLSPTILAGSTVSHATLHNIKHISKMNVRVGSTVRISKRGEIIPAVEEVIDSGGGEVFSLPEECPHCGSFFIEREKDSDNAVTLFDPSVPIEKKERDTLEQMTFFIAPDQMSIIKTEQEACLFEWLYRKNFIENIPDIYILKNKAEEIKELLEKDDTFMRGECSSSPSLCSLCSLSSLCSLCSRGERGEK